MNRFLFALYVLSPLAALAQTSAPLTAEDSLNSGILKSKVAIGGYLEAKITHEKQTGKATGNIGRAVLFVGSRFNRNIAFFSEIEIENTRAGEGIAGSEIALEQAYLKFDLNRSHYIAAGLLLPRVGILNENHLPTTFNGNNRTLVERNIIPTTWRELGVALYGDLPGVDGLQYSLAVFNGMKGTGFDQGAALRGGRYKGQNASFNNAAVTGSLVYSFRNLRVQASGYYSGTVGIVPDGADTLGLQGGLFGTPVALYEANVQYDWRGVHARALAVTTTLTHADRLAAVSGKNPVTNSVGWYGEIGYNVLHGLSAPTRKLILFGRYESTVFDHVKPVVVDNGTVIERNYIIGGITYQPASGVAVKFDYTHLDDEKDNAFINLGIGLSF